MITLGRMWLLLRSPLFSKGRGAGEEIRTLDNFLGKEALYQLSYARINEGQTLEDADKKRQGIFQKNIHSSHSSLS